MAPLSLACLCASMEHVWADNMNQGPGIGLACVQPVLLVCASNVVACPDIMEVTDPCGVEWSSPCAIMPWHQDHMSVRCEHEQRTQRVVANPMPQHGASLSGQLPSGTLASASWLENLLVLAGSEKACACTRVAFQRTAWMWDKHFMTAAGTFLRPIVPRAAVKHTPDQSRSPSH